MERYRSLGEEFTEQFKKIDQKHSNMVEQISLMLKKQEIQNHENDKQKVKINVNSKELQSCKEDIEGLKACYTFEQRIHLLEN